MTYDEFLHAVRAAANVASADELLVFGSQAILIQAASKLAAGRDKDFDYVSVLIDQKYIKVRTMLNRVARLSITANERERLRTWLGRVGRRTPGLE